MADDLITQPAEELKDPREAMLREAPLASVEDILRDSMNNVLLSGIYFLIQADVVIYVGKTQDIYARISAHRRSIRKFDKWSFIPCEGRAMDRLEARYIVALNPSTNLYRPRVSGEVIAPWKIEHAIFAIKQCKVKKKSTRLTRRSSRTLPYNDNP